MAVSVESTFLLPAEELGPLIDAIKKADYELFGPIEKDGAVVLDRLREVDQLPHGKLDRQDGGHYRLEPAPGAGWFDYVVGPQSLKRFVLPPREPLLSIELKPDNWEIAEHFPEATKVAVLGVRACDIHALSIMDRVFLDGPYQDERYRRRRESLLLIGVNCRRAADTCFCHSMRSGPALPPGIDLALTEFESSFLLEVGTPQGAHIAAQLAHMLQPAGNHHVDQARQQSAMLERKMKERQAQPSGQGSGRWLNTVGIRETLLQQLDHPRWSETAERCLACANCTMVCPTCFCTTVEEVSDLTGDHVSRERRWESCFTSVHSYTAGGTVHPTTASRYRQWLTHKLATWIDQFDTSGCVGCGRCITWCPVGIDLTEEVAAIRGELHDES